MGWPRWTRERVVEVIAQTAQELGVRPVDLKRDDFRRALRSKGVALGMGSLNACGGWLALRRAAEAAADDFRWNDEDTDERPVLMDVTPKPEVDEEAPIFELIEQRVLAAQRKHARASRHDRTLELPCQPFGVMIWGDPHLDNEGCDWALLQEHLQLVQDEDLIWHICVGDLQDNWVGRLQRLYADASIRASDGWRLNVWFLEAVKWLAIVGGNHDAWASGPGTDPLGWISEAAEVKCYAPDEIRLTLRWRGRPDVPPYVMLVRHDVPGRSIYHATHGPHARAIVDGEAHLIAAGHIHQWGRLVTEQRRQRVTNAIRVRGYKRDDEHARALGFYEQTYGASCLVVIDPEDSASERATVWFDIRKGVDYLRSVCARSSS